MPFCQLYGIKQSQSSELHGKIRKVALRVKELSQEIGGWKIGEERWETESPARNLMDRDWRSWARMEKEYTTNTLT
jgi:hypothetical protein